MVRTTFLLVLSAAFATVYGHNIAALKRAGGHSKRAAPLRQNVEERSSTESFTQGRITWHRHPDGENYPTDWSIAPASSNKPAWVAALNAAISEGKIPNIPPSKLDKNGSPYYPKGTPDPCNWSLTTCQGKNDIYFAPDGHVGVQFDDGPTPASPELTSFLGQNHIGATHFMIGSNIFDYPQNFDATFKTSGQHIAVHTWSHNMCTTLSNEVVLAELAWTIQIIYNRSGKIPLWWRAPYGDLDNRVRAIATEVLGMTAVNWNYDSNDWCMEDNGTSDCAGEYPGATQASINQYIDKTLAKKSKSPGVIMLEHELTKYSVGAFIKHTWPGINNNGWKHASIPNLYKRPWYANSFNNTTPNASS
ncbi:hypothetical protein OC846_000694 [Tilletia horrida]|uniref:chitin deacetylase n=1 Tax=Tilletia horrida TaxID=155126 RepID=A0AAN6GVD0_9BASI|nr:hypothetical protein OC846_000694 [Tilletia horrida]